MADCQNCRQRPGRALSFDMDLPTVVLCDICSVTITCDPELFEQMGQRGKSKRRRVPRSAIPTED